LTIGKRIARRPLRRAKKIRKDHAQWKYRSGNRSDFEAISAPDSGPRRPNDVAADAGFAGASRRSDRRQKDQSRRRNS
jgi:hypothetical protein